MKGLFKQDRIAARKCERTDRAAEHEAAKVEKYLGCNDWNNLVVRHMRLRAEAAALRRDFRFLAKLRLQNMPLTCMCVGLWVSLGLGVGVCVLCDQPAATAAYWQFCTCPMIIFQ